MLEDRLNISHYFLLTAYHLAFGDLDELVEYLHVLPVDLVQLLPLAVLERAVLAVVDVVLYLYLPPVHQTHRLLVHLGHYHLSDRVLPPPLLYFQLYLSQLLHVLRIVPNMVGGI